MCVLFEFVDLFWWRYIFFVCLVGIWWCLCSCIWYGGWRWLYWCIFCNVIWCLGVVWVLVWWFFDGDVVYCSYVYRDGLCCWGCLLEFVFWCGVDWLLFVWDRLLGFWMLIWFFGWWFWLFLEVLWYCWYDVYFGFCYW